MYRDTFFSSIKSVRGFKCFNLHCYKKSGLDVVHLMKRKSEITTFLKDFFLSNSSFSATVRSCNCPLHEKYKEFEQVLKLRLENLVEFTLCPKQ